MDKKTITEVFYAYPLSGKDLRYFVDREKELDYAVRVLSIMNGQVIGVLGSTGSGKTTYLYALENAYQKAGGGKAVWATGEEFLKEDFKVDKDVDVLFIDSFNSLSDDEAKRGFEKMYEMANKEVINIVYTDNPEREDYALEARDFATTRKYLSMDCDEIKAKNIFKERLERGGYEDMFKEEAIEHLAARAVPNLRMMIQYAGDVYLSVGKTKGIMKEEVDTVIIETDKEYIKSMGMAAVGIINVLNEKISKGNYPGINLSTLMNYVRNKVNVNISNTTFYKTLNKLIERNIVVVQNIGRDKYINSIYNLMGVDFKIELGLRKRILKR